MFRSPISPASFCTLARSSSRNPTSSGDSGAAFGILLPGILIPNHQSNAKTAATAMVMRSALKRIRLSTSPSNYRDSLITESVFTYVLGKHTRLACWRRRLVIPDFSKDCFGETHAHPETEFRRQADDCRLAACAPPEKIARRQNRVVRNFWFDVIRFSRTRS